jgi:hypothetical protein
MSQHSLNRPGRSVVGWVIALFFVSAWTTPVSAQQGLNRALGLEEAFLPDFSRRDMAVIADELALEKEHQTIIETLLTDYETAFQKGAEELRAKLTAIQPGLGEDPAAAAAKRQAEAQRISAMIEDLRRANDEAEAAGKAVDEEEMRERAAKLREELRQSRPQQLPPEELKRITDQATNDMTAWNDQKRRLKEEFITNTKAVLSEEESARWPALERRLTRDKTLPRGRLSGESLDLLRLVSDLALDPTATETVKALLSDYELQLDEALRRRNDYLAESQNQMLRAAQSQDATASVAIVEKQAELRVGVRNVNDQFAQALFAALPPEPGKQFMQNFQTRGYSRVYRETQAQRAIKAAYELPGITPETIASVKALETAFLGELAGMNEHLVGVLRENEPVELRQQAQQRAARLNPGIEVAESQTTTRDEFAKRGELGRRYLDQLKALLTPEQWESLPDGGPMEEGERGRLGGGRGGDRGGDRGGQLDEQQQQQMLERYDKDGDGVLNGEERRAAREAIRERRRGGNANTGTQDDG